jgi:hypothetical protein
MNARSFSRTASSAMGCWKKKVYQDRRSCSYEKNPWAMAGIGGKARITTRRQRSGAKDAAPRAAKAPQSWPTRTASPSPPSAWCRPTASATSAPVW